MAALVTESDWVASAVASWAAKALKIIKNKGTGGDAFWHSGHLVAESKKESKRPAGVSHKDYVKKVLKGLQDDVRFRVDGPIFWANDSVRPRPVEMSRTPDSLNSEELTVSSYDRSIKASSSLCASSEIGAEDDTNISSSILKAASLACLQFFYQKFREDPFPCSKPELRKQIVCFLNVKSNLWLEDLCMDLNYSIAFVSALWESYKNDPRQLRKDFVRQWKSSDLYVGSSKVFSWNTTAIKELVGMAASAANQRPALVLQPTASFLQPAASGLAIQRTANAGDLSADKEAVDWVPSAVDYWVQVTQLEFDLECRELSKLFLSMPA